MKRTFGALLVAATAALTLLGCSQQADTAAIAGQVRKDALELVADYNAQDAAAAAKWDAPDYVGIFHGTPNTIGPTADEAGMKAGTASAKVHWDIGEGKVTVAKAGDIALFEAPYAFTVTAPSGVVLSKENGTWVAIFKRQPDGSMKLWRSIGSDAPPPKAAGV